LMWDIHMCRALIIIAIILAFFGSVLVLVGMKCTKVGGSEIVNARVTFAGGMNYLIGGLCSMIAFSYYGNKIRAEFQNPNYRAQKYVRCLSDMDTIHNKPMLYNTSIITRGNNNYRNCILIFGCCIHC
uniref:Claudin 10 n=1 Tax=Gasterosteus aculeatus aculeatus TaxID=481459 RepID=A0AAQ4QY39_GASAC